MKKIILTALVSSGLTALLMTADAPPVMKTKLENKKVRISEMLYSPGQPRTPYIRPTDQVIVFLDDAKYERKDSKTGAIEIRERKSGDVLWHDKGEDAPQLTAQGKAYRTIVVEMK
ncbi:MAG: hypothetical protein NTZ56_17740 [Acidobacteria bacterium]|nr:hypothetical protein [Acidobacteriota bacterium]